MKTPAGSECKYFYGNYYRGRNQEECRLLGASWERSLCGACPIPSILRANACESMKFSAKVIRPVGSLFKKRVSISTSCEKTGRTGFDPNIGCGDCHPQNPLFNVK
jgi:hypothetical protein